MNRGKIIQNCKVEGSTVLSVERILDQYRDEYLHPVEIPSLIVIFNSLYDVVAEIDKKRPGALKGAVSQSRCPTCPELGIILSPIFSPSLICKDALFKFESLCSQIQAFVSFIILTPVCDLPDYYRQ